MPWARSPKGNTTLSEVSKRKSDLKSLIRKLHDDASPQEVKEQFQELIAETDATSLAQIEETSHPEIFNKGPQNLAILLEGRFSSLFTNRPIPPVLTENIQKQFKEKSKPNKIIVVSDGDVISNNVSRTNGSYYPLGYDQFTKQTFGNKTFVLNCIDYLLDESKMMKLRSKHFKLRLLDKNTEIKQVRIKWQMINLILPVLIVVVFGLIFNYSRKRKYSHI